MTQTELMYDHIIKDDILYQSLMECAVINDETDTPFEFMVTDLYDACQMLIEDNEIFSNFNIDDIDCEYLANMFLTF